MTNQSTPSRSVSRSQQQSATSPASTTASPRTIGHTRVRRFRKRNTPQKRSISPISTVGSTETSDASPILSQTVALEQFWADLKNTNYSLCKEEFLVKKRRWW
mmetsp:Transcript_11673/g.43889  ORF Transcript_11673/g.43889 Transcript_11673/m.43889 type:complete len:103 (+) Transcript_11673:124-432(+)